MSTKRSNSRLSARAAVEREYEVLQMHVHGATSVEIAKKLDIAPRSVFRILERNRKKGAEQTITAADRSVYAREQLRELGALRFRMWAIVDDKRTSTEQRIAAAHTIINAVGRESRIAGTEKVVAKIEINDDQSIPLAAARTILERAAVANRFEEAKRIVDMGDRDTVEESPEQDEPEPINPNACGRCRGITNPADLEMVIVKLDDGAERKLRLCKLCRRNVAPGKPDFIRA